MKERFETLIESFDPAETGNELIYGTGKQYFVYEALKRCVRGSRK